jgi:putative inorganic carbon (HCO3(-)) transporter
VSLQVPRNEAWIFGASGLLAAALGLLAGLDARLAISAALGIAFTLIALADLTTGLALFTFLGFVVVLPNFAGQTLSVIKIAALPLLISWLAAVTRDHSGRKTLVTVHPALSLAMLMFVAWAALSLLWGESSEAVVTSVFRYALAIVLVFVVFTAVQSERDVSKIAIAMALGAVAAAVYGFLHPAAAGFGQLERLSGTLGNPNQLAAALVVGIALSGGLAVAARGPIERLAASAAVGLCLVGILLTGSRGGLIALGTMLVATVALAKGRRLLLTILTLIAVLIGVGYIVMAAPKQSRERFVHPGNGTGRTDIWTVGGRMVAAEPALGVGSGNFTVSSIHYLLQPGALEHSEYIADTPTVAQNMYLEVLAELGIPGVTLFLSVIIFCLGCMLAALSKFRALEKRRLATLTIAISAALIGLLAADIFSSEEYARNLWLLLGLGPALLAIAKRGERGILT